MVWCSVVHGVVLCGVVWYGMVLYGMAYGRVWYGVVWYGRYGRYGMVWYGMVWYGMVCYGMVRYGMVWYGMVWYNNSSKIMSPSYFRSFHQNIQHNKYIRNQYGLASNQHCSGIGLLGKNELKQKYITITCPLSFEARFQFHDTQ